MPYDRSMPGDSGGDADERPGPFDIEREDVVLARVVEAGVPIERPNGALSTVVDRPTTVVQEVPPAEAPWAPTAPPGGPDDRVHGLSEHAFRDPYEGQYPGLVEGFVEPPPMPSVRSPRTDGEEWAASPAAARRRRMPAFTMARRGFEPAEVEMYLAQQDAAVAAAGERADTAERQLAEALTQLASARERVTELEEQQRSEPPASIQALGQRVTDILETAWQAAEELRAEVAGAADRARDEAGDVVRAAEAEARARAADIVAEAERHRRVVLEELASRRAEHDAEVARLTAERQTALAELERLHSMLQRVLVPHASAATGVQSEGSDLTEPGETGAGYVAAAAAAADTAPPGGFGTGRDEPPPGGLFA